MAARSLSWTGYSSIKLSCHAVIQWAAMLYSLIQHFVHAVQL